MALASLGLICKLSHLQTHRGPIPYVETARNLHLGSCTSAAVQEDDGDEGALKTRAALVTLSIFSLDPNAISVRKMSPPYSQTRGFWLRDSKKVAWILNGEGRGLGFELRRLTLPTSTLRRSFSAVLAFILW